MNKGLSVKGVSFAFGRKQALVDVSFSVEPGVFCALLGPNGAGKSTLFSLLTRLFTTPDGQITVGGYDLAKHPRAALAQMGVVFQQTTLDLDLTIRQNLRYFAALHGLSGRGATVRIDAALDRLDLADRAGEKARTLNGGHKRRTEIARALLHGPSILLLDEPTVGLDAATRRAITDHVHSIADQDGITVLWATHLTDEIVANDQVVILHQGRILRDGQANEIAPDAPLEARFLDLTGQPA
ncbi:ATP-binding cassette domain-containing protein [Sulfitobacter sp. 1151]|uniref:ATP-binding cassette domain-containing protein n=1 Tax=Parasulfitobacter algicola TaxID=2614809 RepID=A0ABX2IZP3_9RHOB|nr:ATP-binding cassette domain-containing protein [Sulfitobacter algicola]